MLHACLRVENLEASQKFYEEAFGFKETRRKDYPEHKFTLVYLALEGDDFEIELTYNYDHGPYIVGDGFSHLALSSDDLEGTMRNIRSWAIQRQTSRACKSRSLLFCDRSRWLPCGSHSCRLI